MRTFIFLIIFSSLFAVKIQIANQVVECEIANTHASRSKGLMGRTELADGRGMLFIYPHAEVLCFWMKNTLIPLSIGFFDNEKKLIKMLDMEPPIGDNYIRYYSADPARFALEVPKGWFQKNKIRIGDKFSFLEPSDAVE